MRTATRRLRCLSASVVPVEMGSALPTPLDSNSSDGHSERGSAATTAAARSRLSVRLPSGEPSESSGWNGR